MTAHESNPGGPFAPGAGTVVAGFVDIQLNGGHGHDFTLDPTSIWEVGARLPEHGVTAFLPTVITAAPAAALTALETFAEGPPPGWQGARPLGIHLEGPMIAPTRRGTHPADDLVDVSPELVAAWLQVGPPTMVTLAPELPGALAAIELLAEAGVVVAIGHSDADVATTQAAFAAGATHVTHLFNAMSGLHHRTPGVAAAALLADDVTVGLIADGIHVHAEMVRLALRTLGPDRVALVTDAMAALGMGDGSHAIGDVPVVVDDMTVRNAAGDLAGSAAPMDHVVRTTANILASEHTTTPTAALATAVAMASRTPAAIVGHQQDPGDLVLLDDAHRVLATAVGGTILHHRESS